MDEPEVPDGAGEGLEEFGGLEGLKNLTPDGTVIGRLEKVYRLLSAKGRIEILYFLNFTDMTPGMLSYLTDMPPNLLSFHLKKLEAAGVVTKERQGKHLIYSVTDMGRTLSGPLK